MALFDTQNAAILLAVVCEKSIFCFQARDAESAEGFKNAYENQRADAGFLFKLPLGACTSRY